LNTQTLPLFVVSGPSGSGKTSICRNIAASYGWYYSISHTTRPKKENEEHGKDYYFVEKKEFLEMIEGQELYEWAEVYDNYYGTSKKVIQEKLQSGVGVILDLDTQGATQIKKIMPDSVLIFIKTPDKDELYKRLKSRARDSKTEIEKRMKNAEHEMSHMGDYDHVVLNDDLMRATAEVKRIIDQIIS
jgi:guanylate kinase